MKNPNKAVPIAFVVIAVVITIALMRSKATTPTPASPATSTPAVTAASSVVTVTQADNGTIVDVKKGGRMVLSLGDKEQWTVSFKDQGIVERVKNIAVMRGSQGVYDVVGVGTTRLQAEGRPVCEAGQMCAQYIIEFAATIRATE